MPDELEPTPLGRAALDALDQLERDGIDTTDRGIDIESLEAMEAFMQAAEQPCLCPNCSFQWDAAEARRAITSGEPGDYVEWLKATIALPVNRRGVGWGLRAQLDVDQGAA